MTSVTTSAFDLPPTLAAKDDPALIAADEQHFATLATSLEESIDHLSARLDEQRLAAGGSGQQALERDLEIHRLTARLRTLRRFGLDLCLGHIVRLLTTPEPVYIGRLGLTDSHRAPAAARLALTGGRAVLRGHSRQSRWAWSSRRRYRWTRGRISDYWDEVFTAEGLEVHAPALDDQSAFIASLGSRPVRRGCATSSAPSQADQDAIVRAGSSGVRSWWTAAPARARRSSRCTGLGLPPLLRSRGSVITAAASSSSVPTSPT